MNLGAAEGLEMAPQIDLKRLDLLRPSFSEYLGIFV